jgi:hypothetical protein
MSFELLVTLPENKIPSYGAKGIGGFPHKSGLELGEM